MVHYGLTHNSMYSDMGSETLRIEIMRPDHKHPATEGLRPPEKRLGFGCDLGFGCGCFREAAWIRLRSCLDSAAIEGLRPPEHHAGHSIRTKKTPPSQTGSSKRQLIPTPLFLPPGPSGKRTNNQDQALERFARLSYALL